MRAYPESSISCFASGDLPDVITVDGSQYWYCDGKYHRDDGPAIIKADGSQFWYRDGKRHRDDDLEVKIELLMCFPK